MPKNIIPIAVICCGVLLAAVFLFSVGKREPQTSQSEESRSTGTLILTSAQVGAPAPDFQLTDIDGQPIMKTTLRGKPLMLWFTASYCVPCQIAAKEIKRLDTDLGENTFNVLMVFIDPNETEDDLRQWKTQYANDDWLIAFGKDTVIANYKVRFLDTNVLLDRTGIVRNFQNGNVTYDGFKHKIEALSQ